VSLSRFMAEGGVTGEANVSSILSKLSDAQLEQAKQSAMARRDMNQLQAIDAEMAERASMRKGLASIPMDYEAMMPDEAVGMANGGIVAFAPGGDVEGEQQARDYLQEQANLDSQLASENAVPASMAAAALPAPARKDPKSISSFVDQYKELMAAIPKGASQTEYEESLKNAAARAEATKKQDLNFLLIQAGLNAAAGRSPRFLQNIADAGVKTLPAMQEAYKQRRLTEEAALKGRAELDRMSRAEQIEALKGGIGLYGKERDITAAADLEKLKQERALEVAKLQAGAKNPTDLMNHVKAYVAAKQKLGSNKSVEQLTLEGFETYPGYQIPAAVRRDVAGSVASTAQGAQNLTGLGQEQQANVAALTSFDKAVGTRGTPEFVENRRLKILDRDNAKKGTPTNLAQEYKDKRVKEISKEILNPKTNQGGGGGGGGGSVLPPGSTTGKVVPGKGTEVLVNGKVVGYAN